MSGYSPESLVALLFAKPLTYLNGFDYRHRRSYSSMTWTLFRSQRFLVKNVVGYRVPMQHACHSLQPCLVQHEGDICTTPRPTAGPQRKWGSGGSRGQTPQLMTAQKAQKQELHTCLSMFSCFPLCFLPPIGFTYISIP